MRNEFLNHRLSTLLERYSPPRAMAKNRDAQVQEIDSLARAIIAAAPRNDYEDWWQSFEDNLLSNHQTRAWPTLFEVKKAFPARSTGGADINVEENNIRIAVEWFEKFKEPLACFNSTFMTGKLLERGVFSDEREARFYGFYLTDAQTERAKTQRPGRHEWERHVAVMARLRNVSKAEAEAQAFRELPQDQHPARMEAAE
ncbi:MAG: hypothetical protein ACPG4X_15660 [Pikeienuella sp.]